MALPPRRTLRNPVGLLVLWGWAACAVTPLFAQQSTTSTVARDAAGIEFFEAKIRPIFVEHCYSCHAESAKKLEGGLKLDSTAAIRRGGDTGPILTPGDPRMNPLVQAVSYTGTFVNMPPKAKLADKQIADIRRWVEMGAPLPADRPKPPSATGTSPNPTDNAKNKPNDKGRPPLIIDNQARDFWSFRPVKQHELPIVGDDAWPRRRIDYFVRARLDREGLTPAAEADRRTLIRRLSFDLLGLPPSHDEVRAFVADASPRAYENLVERLLARPQFGERWARHWLDVARYAEDNPTSEQTCKPPRHPHPYRDWVVRAFNEDLPYDEFVRRQLAADRMPHLPAEERAATGFLGLSPVYHKEPKLAADVIANIIADEWDERVDTITRGFLGLTVACARCHDHKFDPIRTEDYYALAGVMASTRLVEQPLLDVPEDVSTELQDTRDSLTDLELRLSYAKIMKKTAMASNEPADRFDPAIRLYESELSRFKDRPLYSGPIANGLADASLWIDGSDPDYTAIDFRPGEPRDLPVFLRGNPARHGAVVKRRFIEVLSPGGPQPFRQGSGRLELAEALVRDARGLTARVMVNRVWSWHFGSGLVRTPSNFGALGDRPSHPELLDDLAARFIAEGWSLKWLHREIVLSATYRQSAVHPLADTPRDPALRDGDNRLLWRMNRRRLEPEAWRDAVLAVTGRLRLDLGGPSEELDNDKNVRRTLYGKVSRQGVPDVLRLFDFPDAKFHAEERIPTVTPIQQLYLLNSPFLQRHATELAAKALVPNGPSTSDTAPERLRTLFHMALQRDPSSAEQHHALKLLDSLAAPTASPAQTDAQRADAQRAWKLVAHGLLAGNEFLYVD